MNMINAYTEEHIHSRKYHDEATQDINDFNEGEFFNNLCQVSDSCRSSYTWIFRQDRLVFERPLTLPKLTESGLFGLSLPQLKTKTGPN